MTSLVVGRWLVGCHARALWPNGASKAYSYYGILIENPTPGIQWYNFRPPRVTPNRGMPPVRRFLSNYFDLLFEIQFILRHSVSKKTAHFIFAIT